MSKLCHLNQEVETIIENRQVNDYEQSFAEEALNATNETEESNSSLELQITIFQWT